MYLLVRKLVTKDRKEMGDGHKRHKTMGLNMGHVTP
jgi:hypothetical protein